MDFPPALPNESTLDSAARSFPSGGGIYLLTDEHDRTILLASAGHLRRALRGRLLEPQQADDHQEAGTVARRRVDLSQVTRKIWWKPAHSMFEIKYEYYRLARQLMPNDYLENVAFGPSWFVHVDPAAEIPRFATGKILKLEAGIDLGSFATRTDAARFVEILEDAFDLCRYYHILEQAPNGQACAYHEMGKCPAPCDGSIPISQYRQTITSALAFACGERRAEFLDNWRDQMQEAAASRAYERANTCKQKLERVKGIEHEAFRLIRPINEFNYLIVQRGGGRTRLKPFFVHAGRIIPGSMVKLKDIDKRAGEWIEALKNPKTSSTDLSQEIRQEISEQIWLVSHYLFKRDAPGLFLHLSKLNDPAELADQIRNHFAKKPISEANDKT
ncbi:MAG: hypothetical protein JSV03_01115 [Planctomycetota bacterium]|nr:MAG: hypothetical protein JSV03_01115 [Planctomycetota bacterium]